MTPQKMEKHVLLVQILARSASVAKVPTQQEVSLEVGKKLKFPRNRCFKCVACSADVVHIERGNQGGERLHLVRYIKGRRTLDSCWGQNGEREAPSKVVQSSYRAVCTFFCSRLLCPRLEFSMFGSW